MRILDRNSKTIYFKPYSGVTEVTDEDNLLTGESEVSYGDLTEMRCHVTPAAGVSSQEIFGIESNYSKIAITDDMACALNEYAIVWIDNPTTGSHDYVVARKSVSLNYIAYGLMEVDVGSQI